MNADGLARALAPLSSRDLFTDAAGPARLFPRALFELAEAPRFGWHTADRILGMFRFVGPGTVDVGIMRDKGRGVALVAERTSDLTFEAKDTLVQARVTGRHYEPSSIARAMSAGAAVVINDAHAYDADIRDVCAAIEDFSGGRGFCNLYLTSAKERLCEPHVDAHELIVAHIAGEKTWRFHQFREPRTPRNINPRQQPDFDAGPVVAEVMVQPGDLLYVPWGLAHSVETRAPSLHLSFGFLPLLPDRPGGGRVPRYRFHLPDELA